MTYLVSDKDMTELNRSLTSLMGLAEDLRIFPAEYTPEVKVLCAIVNGIRSRIDQLAKLRPWINEMGTAIEIINSSVIAECAIHGLFFIEDKKTPVRDGDCPTCIKEGDDKWQAAQEAKADARTDELLDRRAGI